jgi:hypothetical protein
MDYMTYILEASTLHNQCSEPQIRQKISCFYLKCYPNQTPLQPNKASAVNCHSHLCQLLLKLNFYRAQSMLRKQQSLSCLLWNPKVHYNFHKSLDVLYCIVPLKRAVILNMMLIALIFFTENYIVSTPSC